MKKNEYIKQAKISAGKQISELRKINKVFNNSFHYYNGIGLRNIDEINFSQR